MKWTLLWRGGGSVLSQFQRRQNIPVAKILSAVATSAVAVVVVAVDRAYLISISLFQHR